MDIIKEKIISKSLDLFTSVGVKVVTMDMISDALGMSKKTLYEHFPSKEELIKQAINERLMACFNEVENTIKNYHNTIQHFFLILEKVKTLFFIKKDNISFQLEKFHPEIYNEAVHTQRQFIKTLLKNNITLGIEEGLYRSKINKKLTVEYFYLIEKIILDGNINLTDTTTKNYFMELSIRSIATKKGVKELEKILKLKD